MANKPLPLPDRRLVLLGVSALTLSACSNIVGPLPASPIYILRPVVPPAPQGPKLNWALGIAIPLASEALDSNRIALIRGDTTLDYYADAVWPDALPLMVQTALLAAFQDSGRIAASRQQDALHSDFDLALDIRDFSAHYSDADSPPKVTVTIMAQMAASHGRKVVANLSATQSTQASANAVDAVVQAMDTALAAVIAQITTWAIALPPPGT